MTPDKTALSFNACGTIWSQTKRPVFLAIPVLLTSSISAHAEFSVRFDEGAPKDRFTLSNLSGCTLQNTRVMLDLSTSNAGLIFDVTASGAGVEVYQPLEFVRGEGNLASIPGILDGDNELALEIRELKAGGSIAFTIDVDDTKGGQETIVTDSEITGANIRLSSEEGSASATFGSNAIAKISILDCANS